MKKLLAILLLLTLIFSCTKKKETVIPPPDPYIYKHGILQKGETLANALKNKQIENGEVYRLVNKLDSIYNLRQSHPADSFLVKIDTTGIVRELKYFPDNVHTYSVIRDTSNNFIAQIDTLQMDKIIGRCDGVITSSLYQAMINQGESPALPVMFSQIFQWDIDFFIDPQKGDEFHLIYEKYSHNGKFIKYGDILVAQYKSGNYDNIAYRFKTKNGFTKYYNAKGESFQKAFLKSPLSYKRISSYFGMRFHPIRKKYYFHNGVDFAAAYGTPVEAVADGTVIHVGWKGGHPSVNGRKGGYGKTVIIRHVNGYKTLYGHLSAYGKGIKVGTKVKQHRIIGYVGSTGLSTGNHLHYTIYHYGKAINPLHLKNVAGPSIPKSEKENFKTVVDSLNNLLTNYLINKENVAKTEKQK